MSKKMRLYLKGGAILTVPILTMNVKHSMAHNELQTLEWTQPGDTHEVLHWAKLSEVAAITEIR